MVALSLRVMSPLPPALPSSHNYNYVGVGELCQRHQLRALPTAVQWAWTVIDGRVKNRTRMFCNTADSVGGDDVLDERWI